MSIQGFLLLLSTIKRKFLQNQKSWQVIIFTGFALFFVLYVYKAYNIEDGLSELGYSLFTMAFIYGLATSLTFAFNEFIVAKYFFKIMQFKQKIVCWVIWEVFWANLVCFLLFNYFWDWTELTLYSYGLMFFEYWAVVLLPILIARNFGQNHHQIISNSQQTNPMLIFCSENGKQKIQIRAEFLLYLKAEDNYLQIFYLSNQKIKSELIRNTLKNINQDKSKLSYLKQCHRGFMVNPQKIISIFQQNQQLFLDLGNNILIPISQKYKNDFQALFNPIQTKSSPNLAT